MSSTLEIYSSPFLSLTFQAYPYGSDSLSGSGYLTHQTNRKGIYLGTVTGISGYHTGHVFMSGEMVSLCHFDIINGQICRGKDAGVIVVDEITEETSLMGPGADRCTQTFNDGTNSIADADVWITSDSAGDIVIAGTLQTNTLGQATFLLTAGITYFFWAQKDGYNSIRGQSFVAVAD